MFIQRAVIGASIVVGLLQSGPDVVVLRNVHIIDGTGALPTLDSTIVSREGKIAEIGPVSRIATPPRATVIEGDGRYVMPGLFNLHAHVGVTRGLDVSTDFYSAASIRSELQRYLYYGVVAVRSCGVDSDVVLDVRRQSAEPGFLGARVLAAWRGIAFKNGTPTTTPPLGSIPFQVATPAEARARVREIAQKGADFIKIWVDDSQKTLPKMPEAIYRAILEEAKARNIPVSSHTYYQRDLQKLVALGLSGSIHGIADTDQLDPEVIRLLASSRFTYTPTLTGYESRFSYPEGASFADDPALTDVFPRETVTRVRSAEYRQQMSGRRDLAEAHRQFDRAARNLVTLQRAGVRIGLGSDHTPTRFPGFMEHRELELMVRAGLTPMDAIVAGTRNSADHLGLLATLGTIEVGKEGTFMLLDANPLDDIRNTRRIHAVFKKGRPADRQVLRQAF